MDRLCGIVLCGFLMMMPVLQIADAGIPGKKREYKGMPFRVLIPENYDDDQEYPLVFCLHGAGGRGSNNAGNFYGNEAFKRLSSDDVQSSHPCIIVAPQCPNGSKWVDLPWNNGSYEFKDVPITESMKKALSIFDNVREKYSVDSERIYVAGQSMGGYGTWYAAACRPDLFAAAVPVAGAGPPGQAEEMKDIALWVFHGAKDPTVPVEGARDMVKACRKAGADIKYTEFPDTKHFSWGPAWNEKDDELIPWLFSQQRK